MSKDAHQEIRCPRAFEPTGQTVFILVSIFLAKATGLYTLSDHC